MQVAGSPQRGLRVPGEEGCWMAPMTDTHGSPISQLHTSPVLCLSFKLLEGDLENQVTVSVRSQRKQKSLSLLGGT
jgi:hypothetical protein